jgi:hypothetical protein
MSPPRPMNQWGRPHPVRSPFTAAELSMNGLFVGACRLCQTPGFFAPPSSADLPAFFRDVLLYGVRSSRRPLTPDNLRQVVMSLRAAHAQLEADVIVSAFDNVSPPVDVAVSTHLADDVVVLPGADQRWYYVTVGRSVGVFQGR